MWLAWPQPAARVQVLPRVCRVRRDAVAATVTPSGDRSDAPEPVQPKLPRKQKKRNRKSSHPQGAFARAKAAERGTRIQRQRHQKLERMLADLPAQCDIGVEKGSVIAGIGRKKSGPSFFCECQGRLAGVLQVVHLCGQSSVALVGKNVPTISLPKDWTA